MVYADKNAIVLEDLLRDGFKLADRKNRFDMKKAKIVIEKLAKYHAATAVAHEKDAKSMELYLDSVMSSPEPTPISFFFAISMEETLETVRKTPELQSYVQLLEDFDIVEREKKVFTRSSGDSFHVLNHGDLWINNVFFLYDEADEPVDTILVSTPNC